MRHLVLSLAVILSPLACTPVESDLDAGVEVLDVSDYCELSAKDFCQFYLRCSRVVSPDQASCEQLFLQSCNENYEPHYAALAEHAMLSLSPAGLRACQQYLESVPCDHQLLDLDGPCADMWQGLSASGSQCGAGIDSFVCNEQTSCVVGLDLCGTCEPAAETGAHCGDDLRCVYPDNCVDGVCVGGAFPGSSCDANQRCISGASCRNGVCVARIFVGLGQSCDQDHRCQYGAACVGGTCQQQAFLGESCGDLRPCMSGYCDANSLVCMQRLPENGVCVNNDMCRSGHCESSRCTALLSACFE